MLSLSVLLSTIALSAIVKGEVIPTEPGPNTVFRQGQTCRTVWTGDKDGKWSNMAIELMTGNDLQMIHLTTVAEGLDGNKDGKLEFDCPEVDPYSTIYFFQYSAPGATGFQWATRFTIADKDGKTVPPPEDTQPNGKKVGWGVGKLVDASSAKPPPAFQTGGGGSSSSSSSNATITTSESTTSTSATSTSSGFTTARPTTGTGTGGSNAGSTGSTGSGNGNNNGNGNTNGNSGNSSNANANNNGTNSTGNNGAIGVALSNVPWQATFVLVAVSSVATLFL